ncbi:MBL fold metallo-hydrolase RNA specificity domain-containing protein [Marinobacterium aestuariivivens]|uniref:MBL fold metallo-hydrolase RNA specificity domain-containing protein n=1 Tax=Marinobacterium aestuariivivens TaxID=1698799 RepID=A0ABW1ZX29_9GAMM
MRKANGLANGLPEILHHGARNGVTGSCHQLRIDGRHSLLIDCGLFQGAETSGDGRSGADRLAIEFSLDGILALVATHVHIDHVGRIPYLLAAGFRGPILCSEPSAKLLPVVLEDAFRLGISRDQRDVERFIGLIHKRLVPLPYKRWFTVLDTPEVQSRIRLQRAGHILGSAYVECDLHDRMTDNRHRVVFSGDLGAPHAPLLAPPESPRRADTLVLESTYGDRLHEDRRARRQRLERAIERALQDQGTVLIPAFSIGRTQELLYELEDIIHTCRQTSADSTTDRRGPVTAMDGGRPPRGNPENAGAVFREAHRTACRSGALAAKANGWPTLPIILDSPLASRFTQVYRELKPWWNQEARERLRNDRRPLTFDQLLTIDSHEDHLKTVRHLADTRRPAVVIAGSGMCNAGRIRNYLRAKLGDARHDVLFVGYQAKGTPGHAIQQYGPKGGWVELDGERIDIRAGIDTLGGYSAHADQQNLVEFVTGMEQWPKRIRLIHGEAGAKRALAQKLEDRYRERGLEVLLEYYQGRNR